MVQKHTNSPVQTAGVANRPATALPALALGAAAMGASPIFVRLAEVGPFASAFWRVALALPLLWAWLLIERANRGGRQRAVTQRERFVTFVIVGALFAGDLFFWHLAILNTSVANATLLATMAPIVVALGAWLVLQERVTAHVGVGLACGIGGAALLVGASARFAPEHLDGDLAGVVTAIFFGAYILSVTAARRHMSVATVMFYPAIVTTALLLLVALTLEDRLLPHSWRGFGALLGLATISHVGGQGLAAYALGHLPAVFSSLVIFVEVIAAVALAWLLFAEPVSGVQMIGGILILAGIWAARPLDRQGPVQ